MFWREIGAEKVALADVVAQAEALTTVAAELDRQLATAGVGGLEGAGRRSISFVTRVVSSRLPENVAITSPSGAAVFVAVAVVGAVAGFATAAGAGASDLSFCSQPTTVPSATTSTSSWRSMGPGRTGGPGGCQFSGGVAGAV